MNMRKIIAVLAAALLLCAAIPMGVYAAPGDVHKDYGFEDGELSGWQSDFPIEVVEIDDVKALKWDASQADWANIYNYCNLAANTDYVVTLNIKADRDTDMNLKVLASDWSLVLMETFAVTTEWQKIDIAFNSGNGNFLMFSSNQPAASGATYYFDSIVIAEPAEEIIPGQIKNGGFETGDATGWNLPQQGGVSADAAHDGSYGINIKGNGGWGGMLDQTIPVNAGKAYEITFWLKVNANGVNVQIKDGDTAGANIAGGWVDMNKAGSWTQFTYIVRPTTDLLTFNFCGAGNGSAEDAYLDSFTCTELKDPSFDGYIYNGDFETGKTDSWDPVWWAGNISVVEGRNGGYAMQLNHGMYQLTRQLVTVEPNTDYVVQCYAKNVNTMTLLAKSYPADANIAQAGMSGSDNWTQNSLVFNSGDCTQVYICVMGNVEGSTAIVDDFFMFEKVEESNDGYIINGTFETGALTPWNNLWGSCPKAEVIKGGLDSTFALEIISGQWKHVRQTNIAVEANTNYKVTAWAKNASGMSLLVKDGSDATDIVNAGVSAGDEWTEFTAEFNTGDFTTIIFSLMGNQEEAYGIFDNIKIEKIVCEHEYDDCLDADCNLCGETREPGHNLTYFEAVVAANCQETSHDEYWYCDQCGCYFGDAEASWQHNPGWLFTPGECVRPEGAADCAIVPCEVCGNDVYGYGEHDVVVCQGGTCSKCNAEIEGVGCQNFDTPACQDGVCYYCGGFVAGFGHENGAMEPCVDGECAYGCGLKYPATEDHVDADADDYCDNCWNHLACIDEDADGFCDVCWSEMPVADDIVYGDADGDGEITNMDVVVLQQFTSGAEVTLDEVAADADGDGEITNMDVVVLQQYTSGWDVVLGPQG